MLKKTLERIVKCPFNCPCTEAMNKVFKDLKISIVTLTIKQKEDAPISKPVDRRDRCD